MCVSVCVCLCVCVCVCVCVCMHAYACVHDLCTLKCTSLQIRSMLSVKLMNKYIHRKSDLFLNESWLFGFYAKMFYVSFVCAAAK